MKKYLVASAVLLATAPSVLALSNSFAPFVPYERVEIRNEKQNYCLDPKYSDGAKGSNVQLWSCTGELDQQWYIRPLSKYENTWFEIRNAKSNLCLDAEGDWGYKGDNIGVWTCDGKADQTWRLEGGSVFINGANGYVLDAFKKDGGHNRNVLLWEYDYDYDWPDKPFDQHWYPKKVSSSGSGNGGGNDGGFIDPPCNPICP
tara:strand:- start:496 stop:1101 length:606 start_codon:yes stop_codon:yes gene_type:complete